jgi:hypothetical protein
MTMFTSEAKGERALAPRLHGESAERALAPRAVITLSARQQVWLALVVVLLVAVACWYVATALLVRWQFV